MKAVNAYSPFSMFRRSSDTKRKMNDALMRRGREALEVNSANMWEEGAHYRRVRVGILTVLPVAFVVASMLIAAETYAKSLSTAVAYLCLMVCFCSTLLPMPNEREREEKGAILGSALRFTLAVRLALAILIGTFAGLYVYYRFLIFYYAYESMTQYTNIAASQPPLQFEDAGILYFTSDTTIDTSRAVGFQSAEKQATLCVAALTDSTMAPTDPVSIFVVGHNCCSARGDFVCDDAADATARSGFLLLRPKDLVNPILEPLMTIQKTMFDRDGYDEAIEMLHSAFGTVSADDFRYIKWVKDPQKIIDSFRTTANWHFVIEIIFYTIFSFIWAQYTGDQHSPKGTTYGTEAGENDGA